MIYTHLAAALIALALGFGGGWQTHSWKAGADDAERQEARVEVEQLARRDDNRRSAKAKEAYDALNKRMGKARGDAAAARAELDGLLSQAAPTVAAASDPDAARRAANAALPWDVFRDCARAVQALAQRADELEGKLVGWQEWYGSIK